MTCPVGPTTEEKLARDAQTIPSNLLDHLRDEIRAGQDPLGEVFADLRGTETRRELGATYTPLAIVDAMLAWAAEQDAPARVIDPGAGSGRFLLRAARRFKSAELVGVEIDSLAAVIARGNLSAAGLKDRSRVVLGDYRAENHINENGGRSLFVGNPPYVRHHLIEPRSDLRRDPADPDASAAAGRRTVTVGTAPQRRSRHAG